MNARPLLVAAASALCALAAAPSTPSAPPRICARGGRVVAHTSPQQPTVNAASPQQQPTADAASPDDAARADETFDLDIADRRITESDYEASTAVAAGSDDSAVGVDVGVGVGASNIDVTLHNVRGHVRFRGDLEPILRRIQARRQP